MDTEAELRELAHSMDCITEAELKVLGNYAPTTPENQRKRGQGPAYIVFGRTILYPRGPLKDYLHAQIRKRDQQDAKGLL